MVHPVGERLVQSRKVVLGKATRTFFSTYVPPLENTLKERSKGLVIFVTLITILTMN